MVVELGGWKVLVLRRPRLKQHARGHYDVLVGLQWCRHMGWQLGAVRPARGWLGAVQRVSWLGSLMAGMQQRMPERHTYPNHFYTNKQSHVNMTQRVWKWACKLTW